MKRTKIVCTIGPASEQQVVLERMIRAGMNVCRLNMSHGTYGWHAQAIRRIRAAAKKVGEPVAVLIDLQGPKARLGELKMQNVKCKIGERVVFTTQSNNLITNNPITKIPIAVPHFEKYAKKGAHLLIADGTIECVVEEVRGRDIHARVTLGGELKSRKGIAIQGVSLPLPSLTAKDKKDVAWARGQDIDFVALSFVKEAEDVEQLRKKLSFRPRRNTKAKLWMPAIIVKIETREAVQNFEEILKVADAVMIARGDLALATSPEEVPIIQKEIIEKCRRAAKPVIVATEMLASMERAPRPTRAEASDVANAVIDHTDATMLSGESATGAYPVQTVATMARIIEKTEKSRFDDLSIGGEIFTQSKLSFVQHRRTKLSFNGEVETALIASVLARTSGAKAIVAGTLSGHTGRLLSRFRTEIPLLVGAPSARVVRQLALLWGVAPFQTPKFKRADALLAALFLEAHKRGFKKGSKVVFIASKNLAPHAQGFVGMKAL